MSERVEIGAPSVEAVGRGARPIAKLFDGANALCVDALLVRKARAHGVGV